MAMRTREDALRSVRRYVFAALGGKPWRVRLEMDARFKRPFAMVSPAAPGATNVAGPSSVQEAIPLAIQLYPVTPEAKGPMRSTEARMLAERAAELLKQALMFGVPDLEDPSVRGHHHRIPLWDYTDDAGDPLPLEGAGSVATKREAPDYLWVADGWTVHVRPEAGEQQLFVALASLRVEWWRASMLRAAGAELETVRVDVGPDLTLDVQGP